MGIRNHLIRRMVAAIPVIIGVSLLTFLLMGLVPGDPAEILASYGRQGDPSEEEIEQVRVRLGLDKPLPVRYVQWMGSALRGDLGRSMTSGQPVWEALTSRLPATLQLALGGMLVGLMIALPVGILAAVKRDSLLDQFSRALSLLGASVPSFWLGTVLVLLFAVRLGWLPAVGRETPAHFVLPVLTLGLGASAVLMRLIRATMLEVLGEDYIRTARAKGLPESVILLRHALKPSLLPVVTVLGLQLGRLIGGAFVVETIFAWPGLGMFIIEAILARDFPMIQGFALFIGVVFVATNFAVDTLYMVLDPRIQ